MIPLHEATRVNAQVNQSVEYRSDPELYGRADFWVVAESEGDCEDYALAKRQIFLKRGYSVDDMFLCHCRTGENESHMVLVVKTPEGEVVLDNLHELPQTRSTLEALGYRWIKMGVKGRWFAVT